MAILFFPERIRVVVELGPETIALVTRILNRLDQNDKTQAAVDALAKRLQVVRATITDSVAANPDPNPND